MAAIFVLLQRRPRRRAVLRLHEGPPPRPLPPGPPPGWAELHAEGEQAAAAGDLERAAGVLAAGADLRSAQLAILDEEDAGEALHARPDDTRAGRPRSGRRRRLCVASFRAVYDLPPVAELPAGGAPAGEDLDDAAILASIPPPPPLGAGPVPQEIPVPVRSELASGPLLTIPEVWPLVLRPRRTTRPLWRSELAELQAVAGGQS
jgi:hypothetical protein